MQTFNLVSGFLLLALLAGCGEKPPAVTEMHDLRPRFEVGDRYRVREEWNFRTGTGRFPPAADLEARTQELREEMHLFEEEVVETDGVHLFRVRRTYLTSERDGQPTPVAGKTYEIRNAWPLPEAGALDVRVEGPGGSFVPAGRAEFGVIAAGAFRLAATLLPDRPVKENETWPGRDLPSLDIDPTTTGIRLDSLEAGRARLVWRPAGRLAAPGESSVSMEETLTITDGEPYRFGGFRSVTEHQRETPVTRWKRVEIEVSAVEIE